MSNTSRSSCLLAVLAAAGLVLAACGTSTPSASSTTSTTLHPAGGGGSSGASLHTAVVAGLGSVVVDARGYTVYVLSSGATMNLSCTASNGCTAIWPPLQLPSGISSARAGAGIEAHKLGHVAVGGASYPTYNGWRMYEFSGDTAPAQSGGQGLSSFGGTWHALSAAGSPAASTPSTSYPGY